MSPPLSGGRFSAPLYLGLLGVAPAAVQLLAQALATRLHQLTGVPCAVRPCPASSEPEASEPATGPALVLLTGWAELPPHDATLSAQLSALRRRCAHWLLLTPAEAPDQRLAPELSHEDGRLRLALILAGLPFTVLPAQPCGGDAACLADRALDALSAVLRERLPRASRQGLFTRLAEREAAQPAWRALCSDCDDPACEHAAWLLRRPGASMQRV